MAESPDPFAHSQVTSFSRGYPQIRSSVRVFEVRGRSVELEMLLFPCDRIDPSLIQPTHVYPFRPEYWVAVLHCVFKDDLITQPAILLRRAFQENNREDGHREFVRVDCRRLVKVSPTQIKGCVLAWNFSFGWIPVSGMYVSMKNRTKLATLTCTKRDTVHILGIRWSQHCASRIKHLRLTLSPKPV